MNELTTDIQFKANFVPSEITIVNEAQLKELVDKTAEYYSSLKFSDENITEAKEARADLNKVFQLLESERKKVKGAYNEPLDVFEEKMKAYAKQVKDVSDSINGSIKAFEDEEKLKRQEALQLVVDEMLPNYELDADEFEIKSQWLNKTAFTKKGELAKKTLQEIGDSMTLISKEKKRIEGEQAVIRNYAKAVNLDPDSWVHLIEYGKTAPEIMREMDQKLAEKREREKQAQAQREYDLAMESINHEEVDGLVIDTETGEVIRDAEPVLDTQTVELRLTGSHDKLSLLNQEIIRLGIEVEVIE